MFPSSLLEHRGILLGGTDCISLDQVRLLGLKRASPKGPKLHSCSLQESVFTVPSSTFGYLAESQQIWVAKVMSHRNEIISLTQRKDMDVLQFSRVFISNEHFSFCLGKRELPVS